MRFLSKFHILSALAACSILYSAWVLTSQRYRQVPPAGSDTGFQAAGGFDQRLVVFGDSWSDNSVRYIQGQVWTDWLCSMFSCHHENLAQTATFPLEGNIGSVVDNTELDLAGPGISWHRRPLADLRSQMSQWIAAEQDSMRSLSDDDIHLRQNNTIIAVSFGVWDIWNLVEETYDLAKASIERSISTLFEQLDTLSEKWGTKDVKVILTTTVDVTFFPAFEPTSEKQKNTVRLVNYWNNMLRDRAEDWDRGTIYLFDTNAFMLDQIREWQLFAAGMEGATGLGKNEDPGWENVEKPCVMRRKTWGLWGGERCENPEKYLFWNDMHLGPSAHRLMGTEIFHGIKDLWLNQAQVATSKHHPRDIAA